MWFLFIIMAVVVAFAAVIVIAAGKVIFMGIDLLKRELEKDIKESEDNKE